MERTFGGLAGLNILNIDEGSWLPIPPPNSPILALQCSGCSLGVVLDKEVEAVSSVARAPLVYHVSCNFSVGGICVGGWKETMGGVAALSY